MTDFTDLIARVEGATGPDRELDDALWWQLKCLPSGNYMEGADDRRYGDVMCGLAAHRDWRHLSPYEVPPRYTASLDAALELVEGLSPGCWWIMAKGKLKASEPLYGAQLLFGSGEVLGSGEHESSAAIALILALLRSLSSSLPEGT